VGEASVTEPSQGAKRPEGPGAFCAGGKRGETPEAPPGGALRAAIRRVVEGESLTAEEARLVMDDIMAGEATPAQIAAYLVALRCKGERAEEVAGSARSMREHARRLIVADDVVLDTCGTGGDVVGTFNISTAAALVAAAAGVTVAKHGNRSVSSRSGSADVLAALGLRIDAPLAVLERSIRETHFAFLFAPNFHEAMRYAIGPRREIGIRTIFNILGPLCNPAGANCQVVGVYAPAMQTVVAQALAQLGSRRAFVVHSDDGLDEMVTTGPTRVVELAAGGLKNFVLDARDLGLPRARIEDLLVGSPQESAEVIGAVFRGVKGPALDIVLLNAAAGLTVAGRVANLDAGLKLAAGVIDSGAAAKTLARVVELSHAKG